MRIDVVYKMEVNEIEFSLQRSTVKHNKFVLWSVLINILMSILYIDMKIQKSLKLQAEV